MDYILSKKLTRDEWHVVMINADYETMKNLCLINKMVAEIFNDKLLWETKLNMDYPQIKLKGENIKKEYYKINKARSDADKLIKIFNDKVKCTGDNDIAMYIHLDKNVYINTFNKIFNVVNLEETVSQYIFHICKDYQGMIIIYVYIDDDYGNMIESFKKTITTDILKEILFIVLYYYPNEEMVDDDGLSY